MHTGRDDAGIVDSVVVGADDVLIYSHQGHENVDHARIYRCENNDTQDRDGGLASRAWLNCFLVVIVGRWRQERLYLLCTRSAQGIAISLPRSDLPLSISLWYLGADGVIWHPLTEPVAIDR
jgi:hypothetical protein